jgi:hypothetical protein
VGAEQIREGELLDNRKIAKETPVVIGLVLSRAFRLSSPPPQRGSSCHMIRTALVLRGVPFRTDC